MSRRPGIARLAAFCAVVLASVLLGPLPAQATTPLELAYACAAKNGTLRMVGDLSECGSRETPVTFKPGPVYLCAKSNGALRLVGDPSRCRPPEFPLTAPPATGALYFCAANSSGDLRYTSDPALCAADTTAVQITPLDAAPSLTSSTPADGATGVGTGVEISLTWSEAVTIDSAGVDLDCDGATQAVTLEAPTPGSFTWTVDPDAALPEDTACTLTVDRTAVADDDLDDPYQFPVADVTVIFTTDAAPALESSTPADGATDVATTADVVLTFSEAVDVATDAFTLTCGGSPVAFTVSGSGTDTVTLDPDAGLPPTASCSVTAAAADITDDDAGDPPNVLTAPIDVSFTTADDQPAVTQTTPGDGATEVAIDDDVVFTFSEAVDLGTGAFTFECGDPADQIAFSTSGDGTDTITLDPTSNLPTGEECTVTAVAANITDADAVDPPDNPAADHTLTFTTDVPPAVLSTTPADEATDVALDAAVVITFSEPVTVAGTSFTFECPDGSDVTFNVSGSTTTEVTLTPTAPLPGTTECTVTVVAANVSDTDTGDAPDTPTGDHTFTFTTVDAAPEVTSTSPAGGATDVAAGSDIDITFSEAVTTSAAAFGLECGDPAAAVAFTFSGSPGTVMTLDPDDPLPAGESCTVTVTATGVSDNDGVAPANMADNHIFSFTVVPNLAPTDIALSNSSVPENSASGTAVGTLSTTDPDVGDTHTYSLVAGTGDTNNASFQIDGAGLETAATFDFETKSSYTVRIRTTDAAGDFYEESFTISVTNVNEAPTDITLSNDSVNENEIAGTAVGTLGVVDQDAGQTHTYSLVSPGCGGGTFADNSSFGISGTALNTAQPLNYEVKDSYTVCVRVTDNGTPGLSYDEQIAITVIDVNDAPVPTNDSYSGAIGNTLAVRGATATGPQVALTGNVLIANDDDEDGDTLTAVAETVTSTGGGTATIYADGTFVFLPGVGDKNQNDTFTYQVTDGEAAVGGTVTVGIINEIVWYVNSASAEVAADGRSSSPFKTLAGINGAGGAGDADGTGDYLFIYTGTGNYAGGLGLEADQKLFGQPHGLVVNAVTLVAAGGTNPVITNAAGNGIGLANGVSVQGVNVSGASVDGVNGVNITTALVGNLTAVAVSGSGGDGVDLSGAATGNITVAATIATSTGRSVAVSNRTGGTTSFTGAITGTGVVLATNTGATVSFSGGLGITTTGANPAFSATGGGTVTVTGTNNLTSATGAALAVENTTIGAGGLTFNSVSANGALNGIRLTNTGTSGGLTVTGGGSTAKGGDNSGGTIQSTTGDGVSLTTTRGVSLNNMRIQNTANGSGVRGTAVTNFSFTNGRITGNGSAGSPTATFDSNIAFNSNGATVNNVSGTVTVTNNVLETGYQFGVDVLNNSGTISTLNISDNNFTSSTSAASSLGSGVRIQTLGSASTNASITGGSINGNRIIGFPNGAGVVLSSGGLGNLAGGTLGTVGAHLTVNSNVIQGHSLANPMATNCILVTGSGSASGFIDVQNNGTVAEPVGLNEGNCLSFNAFDSYQLTSQVTGNKIAPKAQGIVRASGIAGGAVDTATLKINIASNTVSDTTSHGIHFLTNDSGTMYAPITGNTVATPTAVDAAEFGIRVASGTAVAEAVDTFVCAQISGNTASGNAMSGNVGIAIRKQGVVATTNDFGIVGYTPDGSPTGAEAAAYVKTQNPAVTNVLSQSGQAYVTCTMPAF